MLRVLIADHTGTLLEEFYITADTERRHVLAGNGPMTPERYAALVRLHIERSFNVVNEA